MMIIIIATIISGDVAIFSFQCVVSIKDFIIRKIYREYFPWFLLFLCKKKKSYLLFVTAVPFSVFFLLLLYCLLYFPVAVQYMPTSRSKLNYKFSLELASA